MIVALLVKYTLVWILLGIPVSLSLLLGPSRKVTKKYPFLVWLKSIWIFNFNWRKEIAPEDQVSFYRGRIAYTLVLIYMLVSFAFSLILKA